MDFQGIVVFVLSTSMVFYAYPKQILKNHSEGKCGLTLALVLLPLLIQVARAIFAFNKDFPGAWYVYMPDTLGAVVSMVVLLQYFGFFLGKKSG